jgi:hypothetical protein
MNPIRNRIEELQIKIKAIQASLIKPVDDEYKKLVAELMKLRRQQTRQGKKSNKEEKK